MKMCPESCLSRLSIPFVGAKEPGKVHFQYQTGTITERPGNLKIMGQILRVTISGYPSRFACSIDFLLGVSTEMFSDQYGTLSYPITPSKPSV